MSGLSLAKGVQAMMKKSGHVVTYVKVQGVTRSSTNLTRTNNEYKYQVIAHLKDISVTPLVGAVSQQARQCRIAALDLDFVPNEGDHIIDGTKTYIVENVDTRNHGGVNLMHIMRLRGQ